MLGLLWLIIMALIFGSVYMVCRVIFPPVVDKAIDFNQKRSQVLADKMERMYIKVKVGRLVMIYTLGPPVCAAVLYYLFPSDWKFLGMLLGVTIGLLLPSIFVKTMTERRKEKFYNQLVDALLVMSSALRGGLSMIQAIEVVTEEMPDPIRQEFGVVLGENKMGVALDESFERLNKRLPSPALHQIVTAILLTRETGGNLPIIFQRIIDTIRSNNKIRQNLANMTLQGRLQGIVMTILPVAFAAFIVTSNPDFFNIMLKTDTGKKLLVYSVVSELVGAFLIWRISRFKEFA